MLLSNMNTKKLTTEQINKMMFDLPQDDGKHGDCILIFGSIKRQEERIQLAAKLYNENRAPYVLISGGKGFKSNVEESKLMLKRAIELGIPKEKIIIEDESNNTTENVLYSMVALEKKLLLKNVNRLIIVTSPFHMQRVILTISKYLPKWIKCSYCYPKDNEFSKDNWYKSERGIKLVTHEAKRLIYYSKHKYIDDKEINI